MKSTKKMTRLLTEQTVKKKKVKGFTLIELIVVVAIIGILAAILIPTLSGKVKEARLKTVNDAAAKVAECATVALADLEAKGTPVSVIDDAKGGKNFYAHQYNGNDLSESDASAFRTAMEAALPQLKGSNIHWAVAFDDNGNVLAAAYREDGSKYIGGYPNASKNTIQSGGSTTPVNDINYVILEHIADRGY